MLCTHYVPGCKRCQYVRGYSDTRDNRGGASLISRLFEHGGRLFECMFGGYRSIMDLDEIRPGEVKFVAKHV